MKLSERFAGKKTALTLDTAALARYGDVIDLSIGDVDAVTDARIIEAAAADALAGYTHYGDPRGDAELIGAICRAWSEDFGDPITKENVVITASASMGMAQALFALVDPGDEVLVFSPYFAPYKSQIELAGGVAVEVPTRAEDGFAVREDVLRAAVTPRTKAMILNNPCNPTGCVYSAETLSRIAAAAKEFDIAVLADEIYTTYVYGGRYIPMRTLPGMAERTITLATFSKNFFMTGWRIGFVLAEPEIADAIQRAGEPLIYTAPSVSQRAALRALALRGELFADYAARFRERVEYAASRIEGIDWLGLVPPQGAFYLFPWVKGKPSSARICSVLLEKAHVLVSPGTAFGAAGAGHFRIACTGGTDKLREAFDRMETLSQKDFFELP